MLYKTLILYLLLFYFIVAFAALSYYGIRYIAALSAAHTASSVMLRVIP